MIVMNRYELEYLEKKRKRKIEQRKWLLYLLESGKFDSSKFNYNKWGWWLALKFREYFDEWWDCERWNWEDDYQLEMLLGYCYENFFRIIECNKCDFRKVMVIMHCNYRMKQYLLEYYIYNIFFDRWWDKGTYEMMLEYDRDWGIEYNINHILVDRCKDHIDKWINIVDLDDYEFESIRKAFKRNKSISASGVIL